MLKLVAGVDGIDVPRQFQTYQVDRIAYENFHQDMMSLIIKRTQEQRQRIPRVMIPTLNTVLAHHFLVGVVCGRNAAGVPE